jgi:hypothetical protein
MNKLILSWFTRFTAAITLAFIFMPTSNASILVEPYLGFDTGHWTAGTASSSMSGTTFGGRLGYQELGFMAGLDYMTGHWTDNATPSDTWTPSDLGLFVGFNFPVMLRVYGVYGISSRLSGSNSNGSNDIKGSDLKLGVGFTMFPLISINVEYIAGTYTKDDSGTIKDNLSDKMLGVTVSLPLTF